MIIEKIFRWICLGLFFLGTIILTACTQVKDEDSFKIHLFKAESIDSIIQNAIEPRDSDSWKQLLEVDLSQSDLVIDEENIVLYNWKLQKIVISNQLSERIVDADRLLPNYHYFIISFDDKPIVGGSLVPGSVATSFDIPVMYTSTPNLDKENDNLELYLRYGDSISNPNPIFPVNDQELIKSIHQRINMIGKLEE